MFWMGSINYSGRLRFTSCAAGFSCVPTSVALTVTKEASNPRVNGK